MLGLIATTFATASFAFCAFLFVAEHSELYIPNTSSYADLDFSTNKFTSWQFFFLSCISETQSAQLAGAHSYLVVQGVLQKPLQDDKCQVAQQLLQHGCSFSADASSNSVQTSTTRKPDNISCKNPKHIFVSQSRGYYSHYRSITS